MGRIFNVNKHSLMLITILVLLLQIPSYIMLEYEREGVLLYTFLLILIVVTLIFGTVTGLYFSLIFIFVIGSVLLYFNFASSTLAISLTLPLQVFFMYGVMLIILVLIAGRLHEIIISQEKLTQRLQAEVREFIAVDVETGFDNNYRMGLAVKEEMMRVDRYGKSFTLILLQIDHLKDFKKLYGEKEQKNLLKELAQTMDKAMRLTDKKFRYDKDRFAILLTETGGGSIDLVIDKLASKIKTHQLLNGKYVTLTFRTGYFVYEPRLDTTFEEIVSRVESEMVSHEL
ncbi:diguanylate cyclase [Viridibacillus sp. YIM B01967]|uniref:Diguanylate cyclase n=1 Tax=Viridibacillus soli TaxID=2798301 RepID=A0ABS1H5D2_9BACL|nr:diguanylate cyclase [Viridibacillus soli]MBK3494632.1 diguanylate cyclase [Viridibacillus soli]